MKRTVVINAFILVVGLALAQDCEYWGERLFFRAVTVAELQACLEAGADVDFRTFEVGYTPLHLAAQSDVSSAIITALIDAGAKVDARQRTGRTPLHLAVGHTSYLKTAIVRALLMGGAQVNARDEDGWTPLHLAVGPGGKPDVIAVLLAAGADVAAPNDERLTPLDSAAMESTPEILRLLLAGAKAPPPPHLLFLAVGNNRRPEITAMLLEAGINVNAEFPDGSTPLHWAAEFGQPEIIALLLDAGANGALRDREGNTPWDYAVARPDSDRTFRGHRELFWRLNEARFE